MGEDARVESGTRRRALGRSIRRSMVPLARIACRAARALQFTDSRRHVLFEAENALMFSYLQPIWERLVPDPRLHLRFTFDNERGQETVASLGRACGICRERLRCVSYRFAMAWPWDLIFFADCTSAHQNFCPLSKKIFTTHGISTGKINREGSDVYYSSSALTSTGEVAYDAMFVAGEHCIRRVRAQYPKFANRVVCVGDLRLDRLLDMNRSRAEWQTYLGVPYSKRAVLMTSTWGPHSLIHTMGRRLPSLLKPLLATHHFMISAHPNDYDRRRTAGVDWPAIADELAGIGVAIKNPTDDWAPYLTVADVLVTDHTSLALYFVPMLRPIVYLKCAPDLVVPGALIDEIEKIAIPLSEPGDLAKTLEAAQRVNASYTHRELARDMFAHQGNAWSQMSHVIYRLLALEDPLPNRTGQEVASL